MSGIAPRQHHYIMFEKFEHLKNKLQFYLNIKGKVRIS